MAVKIIPTQTPMPEQPPRERIHNFDEVPYGYTPEMAMAEAARCLDCKKPGCVAGCPVEVDIPGFIRLVKDGDFLAAARLVKQKNALPAVTGRVCPQEEQCQGQCALAKKFHSVGIGNLERFVADYAAEAAGEEEQTSVAPSGKKVAVVGSGPAGVTVAADLARLGHQVTIFEALHQAGGVLVYGIPEFRLPKQIVAREVEAVCRMGVELIKNFVVGTLKSIDELQEEYDAVFIGAGAGLPWFMNIPGENLNGIYSANEYLTRVNLMKAYLFPQYDTPIVRGRTVVTVGGGNVAMDSARTALRLGAEHSILVYRRGREEMPARGEEIHHAEQEGVEFMILTNPVAFHDTIGNNKVDEVECLRMELGEPDASGRRRPVPVTGSNFRIQTDVVVIAIGQSPNPLIPNTTAGLKMGKHGNILTDPQTGRTSRRGVFAGGDVASGGATVILAMGQGRIAARSIHQYLTEPDAGW